MWMPITRPVAHATIVLALAGASGCAPAAAPTPSPAPSPSPAATPASPVADSAHHHHGGMTSAASPSPDVRFLQHMIPHHAQALVMTAMVPSRSSRQDVRMIAERITVSQRDEIAAMQRWLSDHGERVPPADTADALAAAAEHAGMAGMLTPAQLQQLAAARGPEFDRLFLQFMIQHHRGAVAMVSDLLAAGGAQESQLFGIASEVESDQLMEIARMERILAGLLPSGS